MDWSSPSKSYILLEITLISAQDLPKPKTLRHLHSFATISAAGGGGDGIKLRTRTDRDGGANPTWNDKFVFRLPVASLSSAAFDVEILAAAPWHCLSPSLLGSVRLLLSNHPLLLRHGTHHQHPIFSALGIRRPSGSFRGVLNVGLTTLSRVPNRIADALEGGNAVAHRDLMFLSLKELNSSMPSKFDDSGKEKEKGQIYSSPSDQNLQISCGGDDEKEENGKKR